MENNLEKYQLYNVTLTRSDLDKLVKEMADQNVVDMGINAKGNLMYDIPLTSGVKIKPFNILSEIVNKIDDMYDKRDKESPDSKYFHELSARISDLEFVAEEVSEILEKVTK